MKKVLESYGLVGRFGKEKIAAVKKKREYEIEINEIDEDLIIEGKRSRRKPNEIYSPPQTPIKQRVKPNKPMDASNDTKSDDKNVKQNIENKVDHESEPEPELSESESEDEGSDYQEDDDHEDE